MTRRVFDEYNKRDAEYLDEQVKAIVGELKRDSSLDSHYRDAINVYSMKKKLVISEFKRYNSKRGRDFSISSDSLTFREIDVVIFYANKAVMTFLKNHSILEKLTFNP